MRSLRPVLQAYLARAAVIWLTMRLVVSATLAFGGENPFRLAAPALLALAVLPTALTVVDIRRRRENILLGNLGVSPWSVGALALIPSIAGESLLAMLGRLVG